MSSQKGYLLSYKNSVKEFYFSKYTQHHLVAALLKKAFHLTSDIKTLKHPRGYLISLYDMFNFNINQPFQIIIEDDTSEDKSRSQTFSQKALTKRSGRKYPAQQKQLNDAKFYIDDFQFFMQQISTKHRVTFIGIIFFNTKKTAQYLSKKILRELIFEFDQIQFFYGLHPLKRHGNSSLLGQTLVFSLFRGKKMIHERQFPEKLSAIEEITGYLKLLIKSGDIPDSGENSHRQFIEDVKQRKNLIQTNQQRSFDAKAENDLRAVDDFDHLPGLMEKSKTVDKAQNKNCERVAPILKFDSPIKSQFGNQINQISFENQFYQPDWFQEGDKLNRIQRCLISAMIKSGDQEFSSFCHNLDLKQKEKESLNLGLVKVYLQNYIRNKFPKFTQQDFALLQLNMENRQSYVFSLLLKLNKFGNIDDFVNSIQQKIHTIKKNKASYVELARQIEKKKNISLIRLKGCEGMDEDDEVRPPAKLIGKDKDLNITNSKIADLFYRSSSPMAINIKHLKLPKQFTQEQSNEIKEMILQKDPFLVENYLSSKWSKKKFPTLNPKVIKKYLKQNKRRYESFRNFPFEDRIKLKLKKFEHFSNLLYYLYKQRAISLKQKKAFLYLYIWSDLNVLGVYEFFLYDRNLDELVESIFTIDFTYYLEGKYGVEMNELENFTINVKIQLIILYLLGDLINNVASKTVMEKFIFAGDNSVYQALQSSKTQEELVAKISDLGLEVGKKLEKITSEADLDHERELKKKQDMKIFVTQIRPVHFKAFKNVPLVHQCIDLDEPFIHGIFDVYYETNEIVDWIESFEIYISKLPLVHMQTILRHIATRNNLSYEKIHKCRTDLIKGVYQVYMKFRDQEDTVESLQRILSKPSSFLV